MANPSNHRRPTSLRWLLVILAVAMSFGPVACKGSKACSVLEIGAAGCLVLTLWSIEGDSAEKKAKSCPPCAESQRCNAFVDPPACMDHPGKHGAVCGSVHTKTESNFDCGIELSCTKYNDVLPSRCLRQKPSKKGGPCIHAQECPEGLVCDHASEGLGVCGAKVKAGATCHLTEDCAGGVECHRVNYNDFLGVCGGHLSAFAPLRPRHPGELTARTGHSACQ